MYMFHMYHLILDICNMNVYERYLIQYLQNVYVPYIQFIVVCVCVCR